MYRKTITKQRIHSKQTQNDRHTCGYESDILTLHLGSYWLQVTMTGFQELSAELLRGFAECLELENAEIMKPVEDEFVGEFICSFFFFVVVL